MSSGRFNIIRLLQDGFLALSGGVSSTTVGLSIGSSSIKIVEIKREKREFKLLHFGIIQLPDDVIINREIVNPLIVTESIRTLVSQIKLRSHQVCSSMSGSSTIIKRMTVEVPNPKELEDLIYWEAEQYIPFDMAEVVLDYVVLSDRTSPTVEVLLIAVKKSILDNYMMVIQDADLTPKVVDTDFFALMNAYEANYPGRASEAVALVDIGAEALKLVIVQGGIPVFTKDSSIGGKTLTGEIQKGLGMGFLDAETLKVSSSSSGNMPQELSELMHVSAENLSTEIKRGIDFYQASSVGPPVALILLSGGASRIPPLVSVIAESSGLPVQYLNPFNRITYDPRVFTSEYLNSISPVASIPIGLALRAAEK